MQTFSSVKVELPKSIILIPICFLLWNEWIQILSHYELLKAAFKIWERIKAEWKISCLDYDWIESIEINNLKKLKQVHGKLLKWHAKMLSKTIIFFNVNEIHYFIIIILNILRFSILAVWCSSPFFLVFIEFTSNPIYRLLNY